MEGLLSRLTSTESIVYVTPVLLFLGYIFYKEWPEFQKRISDKALRDKTAHDTDESLAEQIRELKIEVVSIKDKLMNDYARINRLERENDQIRKLAESSLEERHILMECNLALLKSVKELGANGPTGVNEAEKKLQSYLNRKAHVFGWEVNKNAD